jgi:rhodanese-related sulfurtransferase
MSNSVITIPAATPEEAVAHFGAEFKFETDCWDVHEAMTSGSPGFVLLDVRSSTLFAAGHIPGAISLPHGKIIESRMKSWPENTLFVTYCAGPHCNGAARGALRLAQLKRPVKIMVGGVTGWIDEGFTLQKVTASERQQ